MPLRASSASSLPPMAREPTPTSPTSPRHPPRPPPLFSAPRRDMAPLPSIAPSKLTEYLSLTLSFALLFLENIARFITLLLPTPIIRFCYRSSRTLFNALSSPLSRKARNKKKSVSSPIAHAQDFVELCNLFGYYAEEHIVQTGDGYLLGLHRLGWRKGEEDVPVNAGPHTTQKKVVYLHHGLLMNSEVWVCLTEAQRCLPFVLVEQGYDVWLGNNRGNKYSKKSLHHSPTDTAFWNFSMDQFAFHDIPDSIAYILSTTSQASLSYIGFSQGTAQAFATLSIHPTLNAKIDVFVALAPAMAPPGLASGIVASLVKSNPSILVSGPRFANLGAQDTSLYHRKVTRSCTKVMTTSKHMAIQRAVCRPAFVQDNC